jgi:hypothetical protein
MYALSGDIFAFRGKIDLSCRVNLPEGSAAAKEYGQSACHFLSVLVELCASLRRVLAQIL